MLTRRALSTAGMALALASWVIIPSTGASADVPVTAVGWWTASAAPPSAPDGGIAVSNDPSGTSVAAVRLNVGGGASTATLKLTEAPSQIDKLASMQVCGAADTWTTAKGGSLDQAPADTCSAGSVPLVQQTDGSWTADVHQLVAGKTGSASVIIKPAATSGPFQLAFQPPTVDGAVTDSSSSESSSSSSDSSATSSESSSSSSSSASSSFSSSSPSFDSSSSGVSPSFSTASPSAEAPTVAAPAPATATAPAAASSTGQSSQASPSTGSGQFKANVTAGASNDHRATRGGALGLFVVSLLIGAAAAGLSWAKAQGFFDLAVLRQRFSR